MLCLSGFELYSRWVPLMNVGVIYKFLAVLKQKKILGNICFSEQIFCRKQWLGAPDFLPAYDIYILRDEYLTSGRLELKKETSLSPSLVLTAPRSNIHLAKYIYHMPVGNQGHPTTVFCKISVQRSKYFLEFSFA